jgi:enoyl-CoA hydratase/carnithine racemase
VSYEFIQYEVREQVAWIQLHRPEKLNALNDGMWHELADALDQAGRDPEVRALVLHGAGRAFSAGYDISPKNTPRRGVLPWAAHVKEGNEIRFKIWELDKPVIAAIHGYALGGACELALICDITIAAEGTKIGEPEIAHGGAPASLILPWILGLKKTKELLLTGELVDAAEAKAIGLVNRVVPADQLLDEAAAIAKRFASIPPAVLALNKRGLNRAFEIMGLREGVNYGMEINTLVHNLETPEQEEFDRRRMGGGLRSALDWREEKTGV